MQPKEECFTPFSYHQEIERAKWFKNELDKGDWNEVHRSSDSIYWQKTFPHDEVPIKVLFMYNMPFPAEKFLDLLNPINQDIRKKWDRACFDHKILETYPDGQGHIVSLRSPTSWPLWDREFVLFIAPYKEIDWFGKQAFYLVQKNAWHPSKPEGQGGLVRATNGGNFFVVIPDGKPRDGKEPDATCKVFGLSNNNFNGWLPRKYIEFLVARSVSASFDLLRESMIEGYNSYFKDN